MDKIKIMLIYPTDPLGPKVGGAETFIKGFIKYAPENFDIEMVGLTSDSRSRPFKKWLREKIGDRPFNFYPLFFEKYENKKTLIPLSLRFTLALKFHNIQIDKKILFFNRIEPAVLFKKAKNIKVAVIHSDIPEQILKKQSEALWRNFSQIYIMLSKSIFKTLHHVYTASENTLKYYFANYPEQRNKFSFLPTWVDTQVFNAASESRKSVRGKIASIYGLSSVEEPWLLFVGRLQKVKAPFKLINIFLEFYKKYKRGHLIIIGEGNLKKKLIEYVKSIGLEDKVSFLGQVPQETLASFYKASDVLLLTSDSEGMPRCTLEALGCGIPVVTTNVGEVARVVKNGFSGEIAEKGSNEEMVKGLEKVLSHPELYARNNCLSSVKEYTPQKILQGVYDYLRQVYVNI